MKKKLLTLLMAITLIVGSVTPAFAEGKQAVTEPDVTYSIFSAIEYWDTTVFNKEKRNTSEINLTQVPRSVLSENEPTGDEIIPILLDTKLTSFGVDKTVREVLNFLAPDGNGMNSDYWTFTQPTSYNFWVKDYTSKHKPLNFNCEYLGRTIAFSFYMYEDSRELALEYINIPLNGNVWYSDSWYLTEGQESKFLKDISNAIDVAKDTTQSTKLTIPSVASWKSDIHGWKYYENNHLVIGWKPINGNWYYFDENGYMVKDTYIDGFYISSDGIWEK